MNFCLHCGHRLTALAAASWEARYRCDGCGQRYQLSFGDDKTYSDVFRKCGNKPFEIETVVFQAVQVDIDLGF